VPGSLPKMTPFRLRLLRVLAAADGGWMYAYDLATALWPDKEWTQSPWGGRDKGARSASWQCGKIQHETGWVAPYRSHEPPGAWTITAAGRKALAEHGG